MRKKIVALSTIALATTPLLAVISCGGPHWEYERGVNNDISFIKKDFGINKDEHQNVLSSYFNATDMLATLGYYPDYASKTGDSFYSDYLKPLLGENNEYEIKAAARIMDGEVVDREEMLKNNISTVLLNEWMRVQENDFIDIAPAIIYTSMADGYAQYSSQEEDLYNGTVNNPNDYYGLDTYEAFEMFAKGLDRAYPGNDFLKTAQSINEKVKTNVGKLANTLAFGKNDSERPKLLVLEVKYENGVKIKQARSGAVYTILYADNTAYGLGYDLPSPKNSGNLVFENSGFSAVDATTFKDEFNQTADEIIVLNDPQGNYKSQIASEAPNAVKSLLKDSSLISNVHVVDRDEFYDSVWGIYGLNKFLQNYINEYKMNDKITLDGIDAFDNDKKLVKLR